MKLFCAYAFTGEDLDDVNQRMRLVVDTLNAHGHQAYCIRFDTTVDEMQIRSDIRALFRTAFQHIAENEAVVAIIASPNRSIGQFMEIGAALSQGKPVYLFEHTSAAGSSYLPRLADKHFTWKSLDDLRKALQRL